MQSPNIICHELLSFHIDDLETVRQAFQTAAPCVTQQAWLAKPEPDFLPAVVRTGWRNDALLVFAELPDADIFTRATTLNERMWELGDVFEIFLRPVEQVPYLEFHVTPNNQRLQLRIANAESYNIVKNTGSITHALVPGDAFCSMAWACPEIKKWFAYAEIPAKSVCDEVKPLSGCQWLFSFSRYDYTRGREKPVISSTSAHVEPKFHHQQDWGALNFRA